MASPVDQAFAAVPREGFLPRSQRRHAGLDQPLPIGHGQTNSQPTTVRHCLQHLDLRPGQRVLDVGCGSGWTTALLAHLVGPEGDVTGVEVVPDLVRFGRGNLARLDLPWARIEHALPDVTGFPERGPFDRVLVSAEARDVPADLVEQLAPGGLMVVPVAGRLCVVRRAEEPDGEVEVARYGHYRFVPLLDPESPPQ